MKTLQIPSWLDEVAKEFWHKVYPELKGKITKSNSETFAMLCQCYSDYRKAVADGDGRTRKVMLDFYLKFCKEFGLTPKSNKEPEGAATNEVERYFDS